MNKEGTTILLAEQDAQPFLRSQEGPTPLKVGKVILEGPADELRSSEMVVKAYLDG